MKTKTKVGVFALLVALLAFTRPDAQAIKILGANVNLGPLEKPVQVLTAPIAATTAVVESVADGKAPSVGQVINAASPAMAHLSKAAEVTGVAKAGEDLAKLPRKANETLDSAKRAADNADNVITKTDQRLDRVEKQLDQKLSNLKIDMQPIVAAIQPVIVPLQMFLWSLTAFVLFLIIRVIARRTFADVAPLKHANVIEAGSLITHAQLLAPPKKLRKPRVKKESAQPKQPRKTTRQNGSKEITIYS